MARPTTNARIFGVVMIITQMILGAMNGVFIRPIEQAYSNVQYSSMFEPIVISLMTVLGFGLIFSYNKKLLWSGLGYTFFITAFVLQLYPLINAFWTKTHLIGQTVRGLPVSSFSDDNKTFAYYLNRDSDGINGFYENHIISAFKCAIAVAVAYSCILGRVGSLECWLITVLGTVGFEQTRQICYSKFQTTVDLFGDAFGTMNVFVFGGFMGLGAAFILSCREGKEQHSTRKHRGYTANGFSASYALLGTLILAISLPFMIYTWQPSTNSNNKFLLYTPVLCVVLSIAASTLTSVSIGLIAKGNLVVRHLVYGPVAGAVIGGASSYYTSNPVYAIIIGVIGGFLQTIFMLIKQSMVESKGMKPITTVSFTLFGIQGLIGSAIAIGWKAIIQSYSNGLPYVPLGEASGQLILYGLICAGMGLAFGLFSGFLIWLVNNHLRHHQFNDRTNWQMEDGISEKTPQPPQDEQVEYYEGEQIKNQNAYL